MVQVRNLGPGKYEMDAGDFSRRAVQNRAPGQGWRKQQGANMPNILHREAWMTKHALVSISDNANSEVLKFKF